MAQNETKAQDLTKLIWDSWKESGVTELMLQACALAENVVIVPGDEQPVRSDETQRNSLNQASSGSRPSIASIYIKRNSK